MTALCEKQERLDIKVFANNLISKQCDYWDYLRQAIKGGAPNTDETFISNNPHFAELACLYADAFRMARGADIYEINKSLDETAIWFNKIVHSQEIRALFISKIGDNPSMTGEKIQQLLKKEVENRMSPKISSPESVDTGDSDIGAVQGSVKEKFGLKDLHYAVVVSSDSMRNRINRELLEDLGVARHDLVALSYQITVQASSVENAWNVFDCLTKCRQEGKEADIDVIFLSTTLPYKRGEEQENNFENVQQFLREFEEAVALPEAAPYFKDTKIVIVDEGLDSELLEQLKGSSKRVLGGIDMPPQEEGMERDHDVISLPTSLAALLTEKGIIVLDLKHIDAQLLVHADNFRRETQKLFRERDVDRHDIWRNEPFLREMHTLINRYRSAEGLEEVEFQTQGRYLYVSVMGEIYCGRPVSAEILFAEDPKGVREW